MTPPVFPTESSEARRKQDDEHIKLLSIFHFVGAGFAVLAMGFLALHYTFMNQIINHPEMWKNAKNAAPPPKEFFQIFIWFYVAAGIFLTLCAMLNVLSGVFLKQRKHRMFSLVIAGLNCLHVPIGTALGVFTIIVLSRDSVRTSYST